MRFTYRQGIWSAALITLGLVIWTVRRDRAAEAPRMLRTPPRAISAGIAMAASTAYGIGSLFVAKPPGAGALDRDPLVDAVADPFPVVSFMPTPPKMVEIVQLSSLPPPSPKPAAPAFPYRYMGRMVGIDKRQETYISRGDQMISIHQSDVLDSVYRVDAMDDTKIVLTYLPLDEKVELAVRSGEN